MTGAQTDRMTRDDGWRLLTVGRHVERLRHREPVRRICSSMAHWPTAPALDLLLALFDSTITFRAHYQHHQDYRRWPTCWCWTTNPRAFACILRRLRTELRKLPGASHEELIARLPQQGAGMGLDELRGVDDEALAKRLAALCERLAEAGARLSDDIGGRYFAHADRDALQRV